MGKERRAALLWPVLILASGLSAAAQESDAGMVGVEERLAGKVALDAVLRDEEGKPVTLGGLIQKPAILTLNYFSCAGICTPLLNGLADALATISLEPGKDFQVITVSFDPRDTPDIALRKRTNYLKQMKRPFPPTAWRFLTGEGAATKAIADSVGFRYRKEKDGGFTHAGAIMILSPQGMTCRYMYGTIFLPDDLAMAIGEAAKGIVEPTRPVQPTPKTAFLFCYTYDPKTQTYIFSMTRVVAVATLVLLGGFAVFLAIQGRKKKTETTGSAS